jgi:hypothetical protein
MSAPPLYPSAPPFFPHSAGQAGVGGARGSAATGQRQLVSGNTVHELELESVLLADAGTIAGRAGGGGGDEESVRARGRKGAPPGPHSELPTAEY